MKDDIVTRIQNILNHYQLLPSTFADKIDIQRPIMSHILSRRNKPSLDVIQKILVNFTDINPLWLINGTGNMQLNLFEDITPVKKVQKTENISLEGAIQNQSRIKVNEIKASSTELPEQSHIPILPTKNLIMPDTDPIKENIQPNFSKFEEKSEDFVDYQKKNEEINLQCQSKIKNENKNVIPSLDIKEIKKIVFFYQDNTFSVHYPE